MWIAFKRIAPIGILGILPMALLAMGAVSAIRGGNLGLDFRGELYPEAKLALHGTNPFPGPEADLSGGINRIFPIPAAFLVAPLTLLTVSAASELFCALLLVLIGVTLRLLGVTDWRVYGAVALWPPTLAAVQTGNLTILLALLVAIAWRFRERRFVPGLTIGLAIALKLYLWPVGIWLLARRRHASTGLAAAVTIGGTLLVLPFTTLTTYEQVMQNLGRTFGPQSLNIFGLLSQSGIASRGVAAFVPYCLGVPILVLAYRRRSLTLTIAGSLILSPIVWLHYFVLLAIPLALSRPRLTAAWFIPLGFYFCPGNGDAVRAWHSVVALTLLATVTVLCEWPGLTSGLRRPIRRGFSARGLEQAPVT